MAIAIYSFSTTSFSDGPIESGLDIVADVGFRHIELGGCGSSIEDWRYAVPDVLPGPPRGRRAAEFRRAIESRGLTAPTLHAPMRRNVLGPPTESWRREKVAVLADHLRFAGEIGAAGMVVHGIPNPMFLAQDEDIASLLQPMVDAMKRSLDELVGVAREAGVRILLENLPYTIEVSVTYPLMAMHQLRPFVDDFPPEQVGLLLDTGHAWTNGDDPAGEIETAGDRLWGTHLQDVPRDNPTDNHWVPTYGDLDWPAIRAALARINYRGAWTFEAVNGRQGESWEDLVRQCYAVATTWET